jgi:outer membrane protein TolC
VFYFLLSFLLIPTQAITLKEALEHAQKESPLFANQRAQKQIAEEELRAQKYWYLPSLSFNALMGVQGAEPEDAAFVDRISSLNLTLSEKIYDNGISFKRKAVARKRFELAELEFQRGESGLLRDVVSVYNSYSFFKKTLDIEQRYRDEIQKQYKLTTSQYREGLKSHRTFLKFKAQYSRSLINFEEAQRRLQQSKVEVLNVLNFNPMEDIAIEILPSFKGMPLSNILEDNIDQRIRALELEITDLESEIVKKQKWPEFYLAAGADYGSANFWNTGSNLNDNDILTWSVTLNVKFNVFDWGKTTHLTNAELLRQDVARGNSQSKYEKNRTDLQKLFLDLQQFRQTLNMSVDLRKAEEESYKASERDFRAGSIGYYDFINSLDDYFSALKTELQSQYQLAQAELSLAALQGKIRYEDVQK